MTEQLTGKGTSRHTKGMPENDQELKKETPVVEEERPKREKVKIKPPVKEREKNEKIEEAVKAEEEVVAKEIEAAQEPAEKEESEFDEIVKDVPREEIPFYKGIWDKLKSTFSDPRDIREAIIDDASTHQKRVYSLRGVKDLSTLKGYTNTGSDLFQRYSRVFKQYARVFEGSYRNEFGEGDFSGSATDLLDRARHEYLGKVKKIIEKARWTRDFNAAQIALSNIEDEVTTRQLQLQQANPELYQTSQEDTVPEVKDGHVIAQWPVVKPADESIQSLEGVNQNTEDLSNIVDSTQEEQRIQAADREESESSKEKGKLNIPREVVEKNAAIKDDDERADVGEEALKRFEEEEFTDKQKEEIKKAQEKYFPTDQFTPEQIREIQREAIKAAHYVGGEDKEAHIYNYTLGQLKEKYKILQQAGYSADQIRVLMEHGIVGILPPDAKARIESAATQIKSKQDESDARATEAITRNADMNRRFRALSSGDPRFPQDGDSQEELLRKMALNTGLTVETLRNIQEQFSMFIELSAENWRELLWCEREQAGYMKMTLEALERSNWTQERYLEEAELQTAILEKQNYADISKENILKRIDVIDDIDHLFRMVNNDGAFEKYYRTALGTYRDVMEGEYDPEVLGNTITAGLSNRDFGRMQWEHYQNTVLPVFRQMLTDGRSIDELKDFMRDEIDKYAELVSKAANSKKGKERQNRQIESIEELAEAIMDTHPEFAQGTDQELIYSKDVIVNGRVEHREGDLNQENFMNWIHSQLQYYHDQDPDSPQVNFMTAISIDIPEMLRTVNILTMINNPGRYFKDRNGVELKALKDEVTNATWLWGDIRNKDITYRLIMPMDEKVGEALMNMYQNNVLTKMTGDGTPPLHWILSQAEQYGSKTGDKKIGMGILESLMIYYNLTDFPELYKKYAGEDSPMFNLKEIESTVQDLIVKEKRRPDDSYLDPKDWATLRSFFDKDGRFIVPDNEEAQIKFVKFFNIYEPEKNPRVINLVRALVRKTVQKNFDLSDDNIAYAEQFSQFFLRFTLAASRADLGAPAMDAGEKVMRLYLHEKGPNATNPGYGNIKAVALRRALGLDFFAGTYVLTNEYKNVPLRKVKDAPYLLREDGSKRDLGGDEEIIVLHPRDMVETRGDKQWLTPNAEKSRKFYEDISAEERRRNPQDEYVDKKEFARVKIDKSGGNTILLDEENNVLFDYNEQKQLLKNLYGDDYEIILDFNSRHISKERGRYAVDVQLTVRKWNTVEYTKAASHKRAIVKRNIDGSIEVIEEVGDKDSVVIGKQKDGKDEVLNRGKNEQIIFVDKVVYRTSRIDTDRKDKRPVLDIKAWELGENEYYDSTRRAIRKYPTGDIIRQFTEDELPKYEGKQKYIVRQEPRQKSTLKVMQDMHRAAQEFKSASDSEKQEKVYEKYGDAASQLAYKTDTMRQYSSNHLGRIFQMFHEGLDKHIFDVSSLIKGWDDKKQRWVFDEAKIQDIFTEQLYKRRRYAYRTYGIYMGEKIRGIAQHNKDQFEDMTVAEHLFGRAVLDTFRRKDGTIDYEYLSTPEGIGNLFKTELLMRLAAEESQFSDKKFPEKGMALHLKLAYRDALQRAIASGQELDEDDPSMSVFKMDTFGGRKISEDPEENARADDFMKIYNKFAKASELKLIGKEARRELRKAIFMGGIWDALKEFVNGTKG